MKYKKIEQEIEAIQWDGKDETIAFLKEKYIDHSFFLITNNSLRYIWDKSMKQDGFIPIGDYIILWKYYIEHKSKEIFESHYRV